MKESFGRFGRFSRFGRFASGNWRWVALILLALALRLYQLEAQSMWSDEGLSLYRAQQSLADNLKGIIMVDGTATQDTNPPLYFLLLQAWRGMMGETVFALR
jgi:uncharacterized membrane protein